MLSILVRKTPGPAQILPSRVSRRTRGLARHKIAKRIGGRDLPALLQQRRNAENSRRCGDTDAEREPHDRRNELDKIDVGLHSCLNDSAFVIQSLVQSLLFHRASAVPLWTPLRTGPDCAFLSVPWAKCRGIGTRFLKWTTYFEPHHYARRVGGRIGAWAVLLLFSAGAAPKYTGRPRRPLVLVDWRRVSRARLRPRLHAGTSHLPGPGRHAHPPAVAAVPADRCRHRRLIRRRLLLRGGDALRPAVRAPLSAAGGAAPRTSDAPRAADCDRVELFPSRAH